MRARARILHERRRLRSRIRGTVRPVLEFVSSTMFHIPFLTESSVQSAQHLVSTTSLRRTRAGFGLVGLLAEPLRRRWR
jgi:hypothetical protein